MLCIIFTYREHAICYYHATYVFRFRANLHSICLNVKELHAQNRRDIWSLSDSNGIGTHNPLYLFVSYFFLFLITSIHKDHGSRLTSESELNAGIAFKAKHCTKNEVSVKDFFSKFDQIGSFLRIWLHLLKKLLMGNFIFCVVKAEN